jgi:leader peptidase (prepilin peptidase) / N-methyltransferase
MGPGFRDKIMLEDKDSMTSLRGLRRARIARTAFAVVAVAAAGASVAAAPDARGLLGGCLALLMGAIALHDARRFVIPNMLNAAAFVLALAHAVALDPGAAAEQLAWALARAAVAGGGFLAIKLGYRWLRGREGLGMGDVKLAAVAGAWLDWFAILVAVELAVLAALGVHLARLAIRKRPLRAAGALPFGLYLAPAIWVAWLVQTMMWWF